jgi:hypothetical protein
MRMSANDLPMIITMLQRQTFAQVASFYGYQGHINGGTSVRKFLEKNGINPRLFNKARAKPTHKSFGFFGGPATFEEDRPKLVQEYYDPAVNFTVKVFEARHAVY